jgi:hypothetical protein
MPAPTPRTDALIPSQSFVDETRLFDREWFVPLLDHARSLERSLAAAQAALRLVLNYPGVTEHVGSIITDIAQEALTPQEGERDD